MPPNTLAIKVYCGPYRIGGVSGKEVYKSVDEAFEAIGYPPDRRPVEGPRLDRAIRSVGVVDFEFHGFEYCL